MSDTSRGLRLIVLAALGLGILAALGAGAAPPEPTGLKIAVVDPDHVAEDSDEAKRQFADTSKKYRDYQTMFGLWKRNPFLTEAEIKRMADLTSKMGPTSDANNLTAQEQAELKKITDEGNQLNNEFQALQINKAPNPTEQQRIAALQKLGQDSEQRREDAGKHDQEELQVLQRDNDAQLLKDMRDCVAKVAKKEGLGVVLSLSTTTALYGENDITDNVIKQMNAMKQPAPDKDKKP